MQFKELGHVVLYVTNVEKLAAFYQVGLGFKQIVSGPGIVIEEALVLNTDATIFTSELETGNVIKYSIPKERGVFVYL